MSGVVTEDQYWAALVAPLLTEVEISSVLGIDSVALEVAARGLRVLQLTTEDGHQVYPAWQLDATQSSRASGQSLRRCVPARTTSGRGHCGYVPQS